MIKKVLVTVKTYPNPSKKYGETVCVAGIDIESGEWIRLYPIPFRDLDDEKQFKKYSIIEARTTKAKDDNRPESFKVDSDSIKIIEHLGTIKDRKWQRRKDIVIPTTSKSYCSIFTECRDSDKSLGMFKPKDVQFHAAKAAPKDAAERESCYAQIGFYDKAKNQIEEIPYNFRYSFKCADEQDCQGHTLPIIDWEIGQAYRSWRYRYPKEEVLLEKIQQRWLDGMCADKHNTYFYVGNWKRFRVNFMVLGVFYPPL
jgi:hypothetical protein